MRTACCIVAAGQGTRLADEWVDTPKALVPLLGRPMLYYSLNALDNTPGLERFAVAVPGNAIDTFRENIKAWGFSRPTTLVAGGAKRSDSVLAALKALAHDPPDAVLVHDAARPCLTAEMVQALLDPINGGAIATLAHRATDTLRVTESDIITGEVDRDNIACLEAPQLFPYMRLLELHEAAKDADALTDDTVLFARAGEKVRVVFHEGSNLKVTYPDDIAAAEGILFSRGWEDASEGEE